MPMEAAVPTTNHKNFNRSPLRRLWAIAGALLLVLPIAGCASIISGSKQEVNLTSHPAAANVTITNEKGMVVWSGTTPATIELARDKEYFVKAEVPGYEPATVHIDQSLNGWFIGNLLCGGIIGGLIDYATGAMWTLDPDMVTIELVSGSNDTDEEGVERMVLRLRALDENGQVREAALTLIPTPEASGT